MSYKHQQVAYGIGVTDEQARQFKRLRASSERRTHTDRIARQLGVTASGLEELAKATVRSNGQIGGGNAAYRLERQGYAEQFEIVVQTGYAWGGYRYTRHRITQAGRDLVARARRLGW